MRSRYDDSTDELGDGDLLARESEQREEYHRLRRQQPELRDTTYGSLPGTKELLQAWERWRGTNAAVRMRGLVSWIRGR